MHAFTVKEGNKRCICIKYLQAQLSWRELLVLCLYITILKMQVARGILTIQKLQIYAHTMLYNSSSYQLLADMLGQDLKQMTYRT